jgi:hypothetical protein
LILPIYATLSGIFTIIVIYLQYLFKFAHILALSVAHQFHMWFWLSSWILLAFYKVYFPWVISFLFLFFQCYSLRSWSPLLLILKFIPFQIVSQFFSSLLVWGTFDFLCSYLVWIS